MKYIEENLKELEIAGILKWHQAGYTGKNIKIANLESTYPADFFGNKLRYPFEYTKLESKNKHGQKTLDTINQAAPDSELYPLSAGGRFSANAVTGRFVEDTIPFILKENIHVVNASLGGNDHKAINNLIQLAIDNGTTFVTSAGNDGKKGLEGYAISGKWLNVGAVHYLDKKDEICYVNYSSRGQELFITGFSNLYLRNANGGLIPNQQGTSFSSPFITGMIALVQQFFLEKAGRVLYQDELQKFILAHCIDLGEAGKDEKYGYGLFVLPEPSEIDISKYLTRNIHDVQNHDTEIILKIDSKTVIINGEEKELYIAPFIKEDRTFLGVRDIAELLEFNVKWNQEQKEVLLRK